MTTLHLIRSEPAWRREVRAKVAAHLQSRKPKPTTILWTPTPGQIVGGGDDFKNRLDLDLVAGIALLLSGALLGLAAALAWVAR